MNYEAVMRSSVSRPKLCCASAARPSIDWRSFWPSSVRVRDAVVALAAAVVGVGDGYLIRLFWFVSAGETRPRKRFRKTGFRRLSNESFWSVRKFGSKMFRGLPNFKKLLSVGIILMFIGGFILTVSNSGSGLKVHGPNGPGSKLQPPIYPQPGKAHYFSSGCKRL